MIADQQLYWPELPTGAALLQARHRQRRCGIPSAPNAPRLRGLLRRLEWDQGMLAEATGLAEATVSLVLAGQPVSADSLARINDALSGALPRPKPRTTWMAAAKRRQRRQADLPPLERYNRLMVEMRAVLAELDRQHASARRKVPGQGLTAVRGVSSGTCRTHAAGEVGP